jgi:hypothetical protein
MPLLDDICDTCGHKYHEGRCYVDVLATGKTDELEHCWCVKETP